MKARYKLRSAIQMERDGIRSLRRKNPGRCSALTHQGDGVTTLSVGCAKPARYMTPMGKCCFTHAIVQASDRPALATPQVSAS